MRNRFMRSTPLVPLVAVLAFASPMRAQTAEQVVAAKTPLSTTDLSGVWLVPHDRNYTLDPSDLLGLKPDHGPAMTPWGEAKFKANKPAHGANQTTHPNDPFMSCFPPGVPRIYLEIYPMQIFQLPDRVIMLFEYDHFYRQIYMDGREHPKDIDPTWMGHAIGKWEGDTLVIDTVGFNDKTWLDRVGHPHSDALHIIERLRRVDHDTLEDEVTIEDPKTYIKPWTGLATWKLIPGADLMEDICLDMGNDYVKYQQKAGFSGTPGVSAEPKE